MKKKILSTLMVICLFISMVPPVTVSAMDSAANSVAGSLGASKYNRTWEASLHSAA